MVKKLLTLMVALAVLSLGMARADEPVAPAVAVVRDRAALAVHIDALEEGDHVAIATDDGVVSGDVVDKDTDDLVIDRPLIQDGAERVTIPRSKIQGVRYQSANPPQVRPSNRAWIIAAVVVGGFIVWAKMFGPR